MSNCKATPIDKHNVCVCKELLYDCPRVLYIHTRKWVLRNGDKMGKGEKGTKIIRK